MSEDVNEPVVVQGRRIRRLGYELAGVVLPFPARERMRADDVYFLPMFWNGRAEFIRCIWHGHEEDFSRLRAGLVHIESGFAKLHAEALLRAGVMGAQENGWELPKGAVKFGEEEMWNWDVGFLDESGEEDLHKENISEAVAKYMVCKLMLDGKTAWCVAPDGVRVVPSAMRNERDQVEWREMESKP